MRQEHTREEYYRQGGRRKIQEARAQQEEYYRQGRRRMNQEAGAQQEGVLQTRAKEGDLGGRSIAGRSTTDRGKEGGFRRLWHSRRVYYREGAQEEAQEAGAQQEGVLQTGAQEENSGSRSIAGRSTTEKGHRRRIQEAGAQQGGVIQTRAQEEDSGCRSTAGRSTTDRSNGGGFGRQEHSRREYYRQGHRRRIQEAGAQLERELQTMAQEEDSGGKSKGGVLQTRGQEEDSGDRSTAGGTTIDRGAGGGLRRQEHSMEDYYRQEHRRRIEEAGAQLEGVLQTRAQEED
ncbi:hypothetical protein NDU88_011798 [Pleurodeles waltl]|uniref:Uncharacterized protein n=1 Tax=Pleurodeles waltl TaxID=8319 RepID=A0AAV7S4S2_PLEWA|nr:hypothetical protein NDU88_011798 [Pleurodeles waltl]